MTVQDHAALRLVEAAQQALAYFENNVTPKHPLANSLRTALAQLGVTGEAMRREGAAPKEQEP